MARSDTEKAKSMFLTRVQALPGILRVERDAGRPIAEQTFHVHVLKSDPEAERRVYRLERELYNRYPEAHLDVVVLKRPGPGEIIEHATPDQ